MSFYFEKSWDKRKGKTLSGSDEVTLPGEFMLFYFLLNQTSWCDSVFAANSEWGVNSHLKKNYICLIY